MPGRAEPEVISGLTVHCRTCRKQRQSSVSFRDLIAFFIFIFIRRRRRQDLAVESVVISKDLIEAKDADAGINALVEYRIVPSIPSAADADAADGYGTFQFASPHEAVVTLVKPLDYESVRRYVLTVVASVRSNFFSFLTKRKFSNSICIKCRAGSSVQRQGKAVVHSDAHRSSDGK